MADSQQSPQDSLNQYSFNQTESRQADYQTEHPAQRSLLPLTPTVFHILLALADEERHGYAIMQQVEADSGDKMGPGTLYGAIKRMLNQRLIEECEERPEPARDDERRRYYRLTPFGQGVLVAETDRLARLVRLASSRKAVQSQSR